MRDNLIVDIERGEGDQKVDQSLFLQVTVTFRRLKVVCCVFAFFSVLGSAFAFATLGLPHSARGAFLMSIPLDSVGAAEGEPSALGRSHA